MYILQYSTSDQEELGKKRYETQKLERIETKERNGEVITPVSLLGKTSLLLRQLRHILQMNCVTHDYNCSKFFLRAVLIM